ncbi:transposase [Ruficoccus amylovorans]|uniref:Transposase n=1 Tax=Ruficoccus amylovorans TaxID=1804625 RepID=A0A842HIT7_9BACT|nr:transposase [Ruficoccus amylovorans]MBC2595427.1 transposase [Ruficoccus amylovorans]
MKRKRYTEEQIVAIMREADEGRNMDDVCREHNVSKASFHR